MTPLYEQRKLAGICTRCGKAPATDDSLLCAKHGKDARKRVARAMRKRRKAFGKGKRRCADCGRPANGRYCTAHRIKDNLRRQKPGRRLPVNNPVNNAEKISARTWKDAGNRERYHGQHARGRQSNAALDEQDLRYAVDALVKAENGRMAARAPENAALSKIDRVAADRAWLSQLDHGARFIEEILDRNRYSANMVEMVPDENRRRR